MSRPEQRLWKWLKPLLPSGHYSRIESPATAPGFPDVRYTLLNPDHHLPISGTIELKYAPKKKTPFPDTKRGLHLSQKTWIKQELEAGGIVWIIAGIGDLVFLLDGAHYKHFNGAPYDWFTKNCEDILDRREEPEILIQQLKGRLIDDAY
jgi:hypothetical protein